MHYKDFQRNRKTERWYDVIWVKINMMETKVMRMNNGNKLTIVINIEKV